jgi:EamA domain-containing membrane protein RarD
MNEFIIGFIMAALDSFILPIIKYIKESKFSTQLTNIYMLFPTLIYAIQPWIFKYSLNFTSMTIMNLLWDISSDLIVTFIGLFVLKETLNRFQIIGVILAITSIFFFGMGRGNNINI